MKTKNYYSNCLFGICYLYVRGKVDKVIFISSNSKFFPYHFVGVNKHGHALHFQSNEVDIEFAPFWFSGNYIGIGKSKQEKLLKESGRRLHFILPADACLLIIFLLMFLVAPLWMACWFLYPLYRIFYDLLTLVKRRINKLVRDCRDVLHYFTNW